MSQRTRSAASLRLALGVVALSSACGTLPWGGSTDRWRPGSKHVVTASWYGSGFQGQRAASGVRFDGRALTAAHRTLPFGTRLRVRNPRSGAVVIVTVTDRGPWVPGRDLDLSYAAASRLGLVAQGVSEVEIEVLRRANEPSLASGRGPRGLR